MLLSIKNADKTLSAKNWLAMSILNVLAMALFLFPITGTHRLAALLAIAAFVGPVIGAYVTYRSEFGTTTAFLSLLYFIGVMELMIAGGAAALAMWSADRHDLCWPAFITHGIFMALSLLGGLYREAKALEWCGDTSDRWKSKLSEYIDHAKHEIIPAKANTSSAKEDKWTKYGTLITAAGQASIPLLFGVYGSGKGNAIFFAAPLLTGVFAYINFRKIGPGLVRLLLLRKLEKENGRRFVNADLEQIQELRRTFFLSRWLMKDYKPLRPIPPVQLQRKRTKTKRKSHS